MRFKNIALSKTNAFSPVLLETPIIISDSLYFEKGNLLTSETEIIVLQNLTKCLNAQDSSFIEGPVIKKGNQAFEFPTGNNGHYKPVSISAPAAYCVYKAGYLNESAQSIHSFGSKDVSLNELSENEYWKLDRLSGTSDVSVTLNWDDMSCGFDTKANLRIAAWNGTLWADKGNGASTGDSTAGSITSSSASTHYGYFILATLDTFRCIPCRAYAGKDKTIFPGGGTYLGKTAVGGNTYLWEPSVNISDHSIANPYVDPASSIQYRVETTNSIGCKASDNVRVNVTTLPPSLRCLGSN